jgi:hypothetical protein
VQKLAAAPAFGARAWPSEEAARGCAAAHGGRGFRWSARKGVSVK